MVDKKIIVSSCLVLILVVSSSIGFGATKHNLKLNLEQGADYRLKTEAIQQIQQDFFGNKMTIKQKFISKNNYRVREIDQQNNYLLAVNYDDLEFKLIKLGGNFGGIEESLFKRKFNKTIKQAAASIENEEFTMKLSPQGELLALDGYQEIMNKWQSEVKRQQEEENLTTGAGIENFFDQKFMKQLLENTFTYITQEKVELGASWQSNFRLTDPFSTTITNNYKLENVTAQEKVISLESPIKIRDLTLPHQTGQQVAYNLSGQQEGELIVDKQTNWIQSGELNFRAKGTMEVNAEMLEQKIAMPVSCFSYIKLNTY
jgi:hypothetical protein